MTSQRGNAPFPAPSALIGCVSALEHQNHVTPRKFGSSSVSPENFLR